MKRIALEEGTWVKFIDDGNTLRFGQVRKKYEDKPLSKDNFWIETENGYCQPGLDNIIIAFPKFILKEKAKKINPSQRTQGRGW